MRAHSALPGGLHPATGQQSLNITNDVDYDKENRERERKKKKGLNWSLGDTISTCRPVT